MRPTLLNFRSPIERTAEFKTPTVDKNGAELNFLTKPKSKAKSNLGRDLRFKECPTFCPHTGQTLYLGPGSYNAHLSFKQLDKKPCPTVIKQIGILPKTETGKQQYIMVGSQIKYEPAWIPDKPTKMMLKDLKTDECLKSSTASFSKKCLKNVRKNFREARSTGNFVFQNQAQMIDALFNNSNLASPTSKSSPYKSPKISRKMSSFKSGTGRTNLSKKSRSRSKSRETKKPVKRSRSKSFNKQRTRAKFTRTATEIQKDEERKAAEEQKKQDEQAFASASQLAAADIF